MNLNEKPLEEIVRTDGVGGQTAPEYVDLILSQAEVGRGHLDRKDHSEETAT